MTSTPSQQLSTRPWSTTRAIPMPAPALVGRSSPPGHRLRPIGGIGIRVDSPITPADNRPDLDALGLTAEAEGTGLEAWVDCIPSFMRAPSPLTLALSPLRWAREPWPTCIRARRARAPEAKPRGGPVTTPPRCRTSPGCGRRSRAGGSRECSAPPAGGRTDRGGGQAGDSRTVRDSSRPAAARLG
jgi:hypothetical protein